MKVWNIEYVMNNGMDYSCGVLADSKNDAVNFLSSVTNNGVKQIRSIGETNHSVHGISDTIINRILEKYGKKSIKQQIKKMHKVKRNDDDLSPFIQG